MSKKRTTKKTSAVPGKRQRGTPKERLPSGREEDVRTRLRNEHAPPLRREEDARSRRRDDVDAQLVPARSAVLDALQGTPKTADELIRELRVDKSARNAFAARLHAMERDGQILTNRKGELCAIAKLDLVTGAVQGHPDGYGFLRPDNGSPDLFLSAKEMHKVLHGDRAAARVTGVDHRGRSEGEIVDVLERHNTQVVGRLYEEHDVWFVVAENRRINQDLLVPPNERGQAKAGEVVVVEIVQQPSPQHEAIARVVEVLGSVTDPGMEIEIALRKHDLPFEFSKAARRQAKQLPAEVTSPDIEGRVDLRDIALVTIDGETARDFDDAVYCERKGRGGYRLVVAIADVSHYVRDGDALDLDARERGTSVYFPRRVIPMLPEALSNELCSLKPDVDRLCMVCDMEVSAQGLIRGYKFYRAVMHSRARLTYTKVWDWLSAAERKGPVPDEARPLLPHLQNLYAVYGALAKSRVKRGAIDFDTVELQLEFDVHGKIVRIVPVVRNEAHRLIEECMLAANVCTAEFLGKNEHAGLYRVHEGPTPEKLALLRDFLGTSALSLGGGDEPTAADYAQLLERIRPRPDFPLLQTVLLRSLQQAQYRPENVGHFGLAYAAYAHFTSPIRRYPDLLVHRAVKAVLDSRRYKPSGASWEELGAHCSMTERRADEATRDVENWLKCYYMRDKVGETFDGTISGVTGFGIFVTLDDLNIDGLVHITELGRDYYHFEAARHALIGERGGRVFQLAGRVRVTVARVDLDTTRIDFTLAEEVSPSTAPEPRVPQTPPPRARKASRARF